jgi:hypothetical protein
MPTYQFMPISADTSTRRWIAAGLGDRPQVRRAVFLQSAVRVQEASLPVCRHSGTIVSRPLSPSKRTGRPSSLMPKRRSSTHREQQEEQILGLKFGSPSAATFETLGWQERLVPAGTRNKRVLWYRLVFREAGRKFGLSNLSGRKLVEASA